MVRTEGGLSREVVKHLNHVEESVLESIAWSPDSPVWEALEEYMACKFIHGWIPESGRCFNVQ